MSAPIATHAMGTIDGDTLYLVRLRRDTYHAIRATDRVGNSIELDRVIELRDGAVMSIAIDVYGEVVL